MGGLLGKALVTRFDRFVQAQDVAPIVVGTRIMALLNGAIKGKVKATDLAEVVLLHVGGDAGRRRSLVGIVHAVEVFDRVFYHPRLLGQNIPQECFHDLDLLWFAFVRQAILESGNELHGKMGILGVDHRRYDEEKCRQKGVSAASVDHFEKP